MAAWQNPDSQGMNNYMDYLRRGSMGQGFGQALGGIFGLFNKQKNPADAAMNYLNQIPGQAKQYYQPYMEAGQQALPDLMKEYHRLMGNTGDVYNQLASGYKQSPGYDRAIREAMGAAGNAAAAGGMLGTPMHQDQSMQTASDIASKDFNNYLQTQLGLYGAGLGGMGDINKLGFGAATNYSDLLSNLAQQQAQLSYSGQESQNKTNANSWGDIFGGLAGGLSHLLPFL